MALLTTTWFAGDVDNAALVFQRDSEHDVIHWNFNVIFAFTEVLGYVNHWRLWTLEGKCIDTSSHYYCWPCAIWREGGTESLDEYA